MKRRILLMMLSACATSGAAEECYTPEATGGAVTFRVMQAGAPFSGKFMSFAGEVCFAQGRITRINASLDPTSVDTGLPELDAALQDKDFFAVHEFPRVTFTSTSVQARGAAQLTRGILEIKGNRREVEVLLRTQPLGGKLSISGTFTLDRLQYGIGSGEWANTKWLSPEVQLDILAILLPKK